MTAPLMKPMDVESNPPRRYASSMRSNASAEIRTPAPKAITAATPPHTPALSQIGIVYLIEDRLPQRLCA